MARQDSDTNAVTTAGVTEQTLPDPNTKSVSLLYDQNPSKSIRILRKDKKPPTRNDQFYIQVMMGKLQLEAENKALVKHTGTKLDNICIHIFVCNPEAAIIYKEFVDKLGPNPMDKEPHSGFKAYLPGEQLPIYRISGCVPIQFSMLKDQLIDLFKLGLPEEVQSHSAVFYAEPATDNYFKQFLRLFIEVDKEIYDVLKDKHWLSFIGGHLVRFEKPLSDRVRGVTGYIEPDADTNALKRNLQEASKTIRSDQDKNSALSTSSNWADPSKNSNQRQLPKSPSSRSISSVFNDLEVGNSSRPPTPLGDDGSETPEEDIDEEEEDTLLESTPDSTEPTPKNRRTDRKTSVSGNSSFTSIKEVDVKTIEHPLQEEDKKPATSAKQDEA